MVAETSRKFVEVSPHVLTSDQLKQLLDWIQPIQQALRVEAESGFGNLQGRQEYFDVFLIRQLSNPPDAKLSIDAVTLLKQLVESFKSYSQSNDVTRRRLVTTTRQFLHESSMSLRPVAPVASPRLKLSNLDQKFKTRDDLNESCNLDSPISCIKGIGPKISEKLVSLGILLIRDLIEYYPRDYLNYASLKRIQDIEAGETATIVASIRKVNSFISPKNPNLSILELHVQDQTGKLKVTRFFVGRRFSSYHYLKTQTNLYPLGSIVAVSGLVKEGNYGKTFLDPLIEVMESKESTLRSRWIGRLMPIYSLTEGLKAERFRSLVEDVMPYVYLYKDPLPSNRLKNLNLVNISTALSDIHMPKDNSSLQLARRRLVFNEFLMLQLGLLQRRKEFRKHPSPVFDSVTRRDGLVGSFLALLPFSLTAAQERVLSEIEADLTSLKPMARLVQGDVGSGKTVVALASLLNAVQSGWQGAIMAPTEVLAEQHYQNFCNWLPKIHVTVALLTGSTSSTKRRKILDDLANGTLNIIVGTHALIEDSVVFNRLGLVVVDEQHRFGVRQRNLLLDKGLQPHLLTMTATPIPRTLALSIHGDLDVSQIDELPPGRMPIKTQIISSVNRNKAYALIRNEVDLGHKAYVVLPLIDESEKLNLRSAIETYKKLSEGVFADINVGLLHGRMTSAEKNEIVRNFASGTCQVLVSTTVVEVGVDVPEATVILIDHADRFGLAQLHQLRGRVGRGHAKSHCLLIHDRKNDLAGNRLEVLVNSDDGFEIAEIDMTLRGPGQVLGTRQSGIPDFVLASLEEDGDVLLQARNEAIALLEQDPELNEFPLLKDLLRRYWHKIRGNEHLN
ncbi:ATP-dependent DNA helicase RecG [Prochlorococcus sp. MIT 1300]|uniref:ATP-dependent DNA helicase RecG n=1 Tax=Prochlorococcus sp. MIT 1300 TaxID=3096218 RepID=UPI002A75D821|nr:ATP-dependent DNA helicase RecG [Prochlorococcus sp. MIT 1300]